MIVPRAYEHLSEVAYCRMMQEYHASQARDWSAAGREAATAAATYRDRLVQLGELQPHPEGTASDVERDALRYRWVRQPWGAPREVDATIDAEIWAAAIWQAFGGALDGSGACCPTGSRRRV